ncbi:MAG: ABC transporter permease [Chloroflexi bacterium]|nr:ABC transporter permease [Chloroflexota bacterium]MBV9898549.1 ABC transporter permease [Chloroflexota bacterium]
MSSSASTVASPLITPPRIHAGQRQGSWVRRQRPWVQVLLRITRNPMGAFGLAIVLLMAFLAILAPVIAPYSPVAQHPGQELQPPGAQFWLGSDDLGRDLFSRILFGARVSFVVGIVATALGAGIGVSTGLVSGYTGGWIDSVIMRFYDALLAFPGIIIGIAVISILGPSTLNVAYALAIGGMPFFARLMRSSVLSERERDYVYAARCIGARDGRIMFLHLLPNTLAPLLVQLSLAMGFAVLAEAGLSFLGLGTQPPDPSWGTMLNDSRAYLREAPWYGLWPGVALTVLLVALNYLSDALRDALDPKRANLR